MKANFDISLPSIPGKTIKFKIQDIKSAAFGTQKSRFPDDKSQLVKKFVDSFHNFHEPKEQDELQTQAESQMARSHVSQRKQVKFRSMISENKKFLLPLFNQIKKKEKDYNFEYANSNLTSKGGYTFNKSQDKISKSQHQKNTTTTTYDKTLLTDNYYFTQNQIQYDGQQDEKQKKMRPSAIFKNQTRKRVYERLDYSSVPGPGAYIKDKPVKKNQKKKKSLKKTSSNDEQMDYNHLKELITKVIAQDPEEQEQPEVPKQLKNDHMFIVDDRDRFGQQIFPIAPKLKVPGPGTYEINDTMEDRAKKLIVVEQQRKLLKEWFNN